MVVEIVGGLLASSLALLSDAGAHAHRRRRDRPGARRRPARRAAGGRALHVRARPGGDPLGAGQRRRPCSSSPGSSRSPRSSACSRRPTSTARSSSRSAWSGRPSTSPRRGRSERAERRSLNVEGARQHVLTDLYASLAAVAAGAVVLVTGFDRADGIAALFVAALMLRSGWSLLRDSGRVLLEARAGGHGPAGDRPGDGRRARRRRGPRPPHLGGHLRLPGACGARARPARRRLPRRPPPTCSGCSPTASRSTT